MRFIGIDIGAENHFVAILDEMGVTTRKVTLRVVVATAAVATLGLGAWVGPVVSSGA